MNLSNTHTPSSTGLFNFTKILSGTSSLTVPFYLNNIYSEHQYACSLTQFSE